MKINAVISQQNIKPFSGVIHSLAKIGKELIFEINSEQISLQIMNDAKSAFALVEFSKSGFFDLLSIDSNENNAFSCKLTIKPLCAIFNHRTLKVVEKMRIYSNVSNEIDNELVFEFICGKGIKRTFRFLYQDCDIVSVLFDETTIALSSLESSPKVFSRLLDHTHAHEIILEACSKIFKVKSFYQDQFINSRKAGHGGESQMTSAMSMDTKEFMVYHFHHSSDNSNREDSEELVCCVRELRGFLALCESIDVSSFRLQFSEAGRPIRLTCESDNIVAQLVLATMTPYTHDDFTQSQTNEVEPELVANVPEEMNIVIDSATDVTSMTHNNNDFEEGMQERKKSRRLLYSSSEEENEKEE